jgi:ABC-2 type transport system permease protein
VKDVATVMWKEWRELRAQGEFGPAATWSVIIILALAIAGVAAAGGPALLRTPMPLICMWVPLFAVMGSVCESFAGERERHTLETLLASRLSSESLLAGKIAVHVAYGWASALALLALFTLGANAPSLREGFTLPTIGVLLAVFLVTPLMLFCVAAAGVLVSLRAPTVRIAQARLIAGGMTAFIALVLLSLLMPAQWKQAARDAAKSPHLALIATLSWAAIFAVADVALLLAAYAQFRRDKLIAIR